MAAKQDNINFINFNQDFTCISVGTSSGYKIYNCDPFGKCFSKRIPVVGIGDQPSLSPRRLKIMNTKRQSTICELTFPTAVLRVLLNRRRLVVVLEEQIYIYDISNMKLLLTIETAPNPNAVAALSPSSDSCYLVYPSGAPMSRASASSSAGPAGNAANISSTSPSNATSTSHTASAGSTNTSPAAFSASASSASSSAPGELKIFDCLTLRPVNIVAAHKTPVAVVAINSEGTLMATASDRGTIIRIFSVPNGDKLYQFRRGTYPSKIFCINFNLVSSLICVSSATETVHIFKLGRNQNQPLIGGVGLVPSTTSNSAGAASSSPSSPNGNTSRNRLPDSANSIGIEKDDDDEDDENIISNQPVDEEDSDVPQEFITQSPSVKHRQRSKSGLEGYIESKRQVLGKHVAGYLPKGVTEMWEKKQRDFAYFKLPADSGTKSVVALSNYSQHAYVVTAEGFFYQYAVDLTNGGECKMVKQYSILTSED